MVTASGMPAMFGTAFKLSRWHCGAVWPQAQPASPLAQVPSLVCCCVRMTPTVGTWRGRLTWIGPLTQLELGCGSPLVSDPTQVRARRIQA